MIRFLRNFVGFVLASVPLLATLIAAFAVIAMTLVLWREGRLGERDLELLHRGAIAAVVGGVCTWAGFRLAHGKRHPGEARNASFTLVRSKDGRQEKFVAAFSGIVYLAGFGGWLWTRAEGEPWLRALQVAGWLGLVYLGLHLRILLHELGHLAAAGCVRLNVTTVRVGAGWQLWSTQTRGGVCWEWRLRPTGGWVVAHHRDEASFRWRQFVFVAGGPLVDALLITTLWLNCGIIVAPRRGSAPSPCCAVACWQSCSPHEEAVSPVAWPMPVWPRKLPGRKCERAHCGRVATVPAAPDANSSLEGITTRRMVPWQGITGSQMIPYGG